MQNAGFFCCMPEDYKMIINGKNINSIEPQPEYRLYNIEAFCQALWLNYEAVSSDLLKPGYNALKLGKELWADEKSLVLWLLKPQPEKTMSLAAMEYAARLIENQCEKLNLEEVPDQQW
jgi:hypothetical protein